MKKQLLFGALLGALTFTAHAGLFDQIATGTWDSVEPTAAYKLETYGYNVRVYEWTPKDNPNTRCVFVAGETNSTGVACYPVDKDKQK
ncbi:hypothetical protein QKW35_14860 [Pontibacterium granulatum]|uniref:hypothetical protein n=1 Tax=Pontibacterium granulatum TaxID=2036029 RepID=UPI00249C483F|nr:hypothetical protein [Pontibacterium granulatum]MDI3325657.1 hypothetical protein [Pontibacterium granulatum]